MMQKENAVIVSEMPAERSKNHVILTSWASVATALLLVVLIGGAFYVADLRGRQCNASVSVAPQVDSDNSKAYEKTFKEDGRQTKEDFYLDGISQTELIVKKSADGNIAAIAEIDYKTKITAVYVPSAGKCVLAAGIQVNWLDQWNFSPNKTEEDRLEEVIYAVSDNKVTDLSIVPDGMIPYCKGKSTYWLQPENATEKGGRQKRASRGPTITISITIKF